MTSTPTHFQTASISIANPTKFKCGDASIDVTFRNSNCTLILVSDGVSMKPKDFWASATVRDTIVEQLSPLKEITEYNIEVAVSIANEALKVGVDGIKGMLATLSLLCYNPGIDRIYYTNIGDSRIYGLKDNVFEQISEDDVKHIPFMENGKIKLSKGVPIFATGLSKAMGDGELNVIVKSIPFNRYDCMVLATDGAYRLNDFEIMISKAVNELDLAYGFSRLWEDLPNLIEDDASVALLRKTDVNSIKIIAQIIGGQNPLSTTQEFVVRIAINTAINDAIPKKDLVTINAILEFMGNNNLSISKEIMIDWLNSLVKIEGARVQFLSNLIRKL